MEKLFPNVVLKKLNGDIDAQARAVIHYVFLFLKELKTDPEKKACLNFNNPRELAALICGVSRVTVDRIKTEVSQASNPNIPRANVKKTATVTDLDSFDVSVLKRTIDSFYDNGEYPLVATILEKYQEQMPNFNCGYSSMRNILTTYLMERADIVYVRVDFLRKTNDQRSRIYLDETWVNQNHSRKRMRFGTNDEGGFKNQPVGKDGFAPDTKFIFKAVKSKDADYHIEMNGDSYTAWFFDLLNVLEKPSVIVIDNASYHSMQLERIPTSSTKKSDIQEWLTKKKIPFSNTDIREELLRKLAYERDQEVIRLPPYHCQYNSIELIWAPVKGEVAAKNHTFNIADVEILLHNAIDNITQEDWVKCVRRTEELQDKDLRKTILRDQASPLIINLQEDDTDGEDADEDF
ncbi:hypothetical protein K1T71_000073 [Dendrolimus kikuchii]|uniref:Uncharacterized protein n=1 Tax=Dendrolimus kikuchii TaxID=765133 RepID=A0ACC1DIH0_9NEOP|nr:hypothetical protein K1T71_000073 [Dendrolimus kikuchii]